MHSGEEENDSYWIGYRPQLAGADKTPKTGCCVTEATTAHTAPLPFCPS